jgi:hypothetical protein
MVLSSRWPLRGLLVVLLAVGATVLAPAAVLAAEDVATTTTLEIEGGGIYGDRITLRATVTSETGVPAGSVQFLDGDQPMGDPVPVDTAGRAVHTQPAVVGLHRYRAAFVGAAGYADSEASQLHGTIASGMVIRSEPTILAPGLRPTLTLSAYAEDVRGRPAVGEELTFSIFGRQPNPFDFGGGRVVCTAVTDQTGFASCGVKGLVPAVLSLLAHTYVSHAASGNYGYSSASAPVIRLR